MKVLLYTEGLKTVGKSGLGKAINHQMKALDYAKIPYTLDPHDDYDILLVEVCDMTLDFLLKRLKEKGKKLYIMLILQKKTIKMGLYLLNRLQSFLKNGLLNVIV